MKMNAYVAGVGMTRFGKQMDKTLKGLAGEAIQLALADAGIDKSALQAAWMGNAAAGIVTGQEMIRGQVALREHGHRQDPGGQRRECLRLVVDRLPAGLRHGHGRASTTWCWPAAARSCSTRTRRAAWAPSPVRWTSRIRTAR